jgi:formate hydrogenlyase subunit 6/NADH:ubiquinone oxidoreductase subunit I
MRRPGSIIDQAFKSFFKKPITEQYPFQKAKLIDKFRGRIKFEASLCIGCKLCVRDCPSDAITITKVGEKKYTCIIDLSRCIYCAQCVDTCPKDALSASVDFELAQTDPNKLKITYGIIPDGSELAEGDKKPT